MYAQHVVTIHGDIFRCGKYHVCDLELPGLSALNDPQRYFKLVSNKCFCFCLFFCEEAKNRKNVGNIKFLILLTE